MNRERWERVQRKRSTEWTKARKLGISVARLRALRTQAALGSSDERASANEQLAQIGAFADARRKKLNAHP